MNFKISPSPLRGTVRSVTSKSQMHRMLICASLSRTPTKIVCNTTSADIRATISCLCALGANIRQISSTEYSVAPIPQKNGVYLPNRGAVLDCMESGSTLRFLIPVAAALGADVTFTGKGRLPSRPLSPLTESLSGHGAVFSVSSGLPLSIRGKLQSGNYEIPGHISSQFVSGLLFALPLLSSPSKVRLTSPASSRPYIDLTLDALQKSNVSVSTETDCYSISPTSEYRMPDSVSIEGDWSNAAFWIVSGVLHDGVVCSGVSLNSLQGDRKIIDILSEFGAHFTYRDNRIIPHLSKMHGISIDASDIPDLVPILAVAAAYAEGVTIIHHAQRLRDKESDRLASTAAFLSKMGANIRETADGLVINGGTPLHGGIISSANDHRIAMAAAIAATKAQSPLIIEGAEAVEKSYPHFFDDLTMLGGKAEALAE